MKATPVTRQGFEWLETFRIAPVELGEGSKEERHAVDTSTVC